MGGKRISGVGIQRESDSYTDALFAVLKKVSYFDRPKYMLSGMTGMTFKFISHKRMLTASTYIYSMDIDCWKAVDRLGIYNEIYWGYKTNPTFPLYQKRISDVKNGTLWNSCPAYCNGFVFIVPPVYSMAKFNKNNIPHTLSLLYLEI